MTIRPVTKGVQAKIRRDFETVSSNTALTSTDQISLMLYSIKGGFVDKVIEGLFILLVLILVRLKWKCEGKFCKYFRFIMVDSILIIAIGGGVIVALQH